MSDPKLIIAVRTDLRLRRGKEAAQVGHASMAWAVKAWNEGFAAQLTLEWARGLQKKIVVGVDSLDELQRLIEMARGSYVPCYVIEDAGLTEIPPGTITCAAFGPEAPAVLDPLFGHLKLR